MRRSPDLASVVAGLAIVAFGAVLMADALEAIELSLAWLGPLVFGVAGAILVAVGLGRDR